jgi:AcrR family transcriptional regulator
MLKSAQPKPTTSAELKGRKVILTAATRLFLERGYRGTTMELVAAAAGFGRQTVYNQFESKKALFDATVAVLWEKLPAATITNQQGSLQQAEQILFEVGHAIAETWASEEAVAFVRMIVAESMQFPELAESFFRVGRDPARHAVMQYLNALNGTAQWDVPDPELAAAQFVGLLNESLLWSRIIRDPKTLPKERRTRIVTEAVRTFTCRYKVAGTRVHQTE